jgi:rhamnose utilization protein RhaD (predicted bifunctional aldolase and dehydrogenase)
MISIDSVKTAKDVKAFCSHIGKDILLVQGAGGNVSWKDGNILWIKASGKWLSEAEKEEILIPVDLVHLKNEISKDNFSATPIKKDNTNLRPSIETMLHALMPHKIVIHLHPVEILAHLVRKKPIKNLNELIKSSIKWTVVEYFQPGAALAKATSEQLDLNPESEVIFLKNHGIIIGGEKIKKIQDILERLLLIFRNDILKTDQTHDQTTFSKNFHIDGFSISNQKEINRLAKDHRLSKRLQREWVLYPDHAVFLGARAIIVNNEESFKTIEVCLNKAPYIFFIGYGVMENNSITNAQKIQLLCYYNVLIRQSENEKLSPLKEENVIALLNWDAEEYRRIISSKKVNQILS